nr:hypothetical protein [Comamonas koreensis]
MVDLIANAATYLMPCCAANYATDECANDGAKCTAQWACNHSDGRSCGGSLYSASHAGHGACCTTYALTYPLGYALAVHIDGLAAQTLN